ncbi:hypothetical protein QBC32DRAFT_353413 [Pseudoneurospora amorphoporcata]|uniref:Uncharacterized protein n=1 Tax=Pseudoneurospora amorphoporcata TaxID=241081 RepID=A0AAN6NMV8_9PEZI|nr:hypothetical protein QBC32DRAFT_353413 [Pseudoneurospora amorphoporcata]
MDFPFVDKEDCILWLNIGDVDLFEKVLFPAGCRIQESGHDGSDGRYSLQRACCAAAALIFGSQLYEAIDTSRLRTWERETAGLTDTTDCITIEVHATHEPRYGTLRLRLEFLRGVRIAQRLFAIPNASHI